MNIGRKGKMTAQYSDRKKTGFTENKLKTENIHVHFIFIKDHRPSKQAVNRKPLKPLFFSEKPLKTFIFRKSWFFSVFRVSRSYKILYFQQCPILSYILSICLIFQGI